MAGYRSRKVERLLEGLKPGEDIKTSTGSYREGSWVIGYVTVQIGERPPENIEAYRFVPPIQQKMTASGKAKRAAARLEEEIKSRIDARARESAG